jgi:hypothetical protein
MVAKIGLRVPQDDSVFVGRERMSAKPSYLEAFGTARIFG